MLVGIDRTRAVGSRTGSWHELASPETGMWTRWFGNHAKRMSLHHFLHLQHFPSREYIPMFTIVSECTPNNHYYKNLKKPKKYIEDSEEIGRFPKKDSYIIQQNANSPREESLSVIKIPNKYDSNLTNQFLKVSKEKHVDIKSEEMELNELTSNSSVENLFNAIIVGEQTTNESVEDQELYDGIIVGEQTTIESVEDQELYDGIIVGESEEEDSEATFQPIMKYSETVKSDRRITQFDSDTQPEEITYNITVFADENNENKMVAHAIEKLLLEIDLDDFMTILINYMRTHNDELTFNKFNEILSNRKGNRATKLPCISDELRRKLIELGNTPLPYIYFDKDDDISSENGEVINEYDMN
ncbi:hypothetical protein CBL_09398 [Carabus blaptoides fortunei]